MDKLQSFLIPRDDLKVEVLTRDEKLLDEMMKSAPNKTVLTDAHDYYTDIVFPEAPEDRPYAFCSVVLSADGKMAFQDDPRGPQIAKQNRLDPNGALCDFWVLNMLRAYADAVIIGARTLHTEPGVTSHVYDTELARQRVEELGKKEHPLGVIVSFDATDIPFDASYFHIDRSERYKSIIMTSPQGVEYIKENSPLKHVYYGPFKTREDVDAFEFPEVYADFDTFPVICTGEGDRPDTELAMYILRKMGMGYICIESPSYCISLMHLKMLDEYFINYSMVYACGTITPGYSMPFPAGEHPHARLVSLCMHKHNFLYSRQKIYYDVPADVDLSTYKY